MFLFALLLELLQILLPMPLKRHIQTLNDLGRNHKKQKFVSDGASWASLPKEIQIMILEVVAQCRRPTAGHSPGRIATYATVSLEWQGFFEKITFRRLTLDFPALEFFGGAVSGEKHIHRLNYIRHIWLRIKLLDYTCLTCSEAENGYTIYRNNEVFTRAMRTLLGILSTWDGHAAGGLTLEFSAHSPSDMKHTFCDLKLADNYPFNHEEDLENYTFLGDNSREVLNLRHYADPAPFNGARQRTTPTLGEMQRLYGTPLHLYCDTCKTNGGYTDSVAWLPRAPIVRGLLTRYQFYREMAPNALAKLFRESLVCLEWVRLERRYRPSYEDEVTYLRGFQRYVLPSLPRSLRRFTYFSQSSVGVRMSQSAVPDLAIYAKDALSGSNTGLKELSVCPLGGTLKFLKQFNAAEQMKVSPPWKEIMKECLEHLDERERDRPPVPSSDVAVGIDKKSAWQKLQQHYMDLSEFGAPELKTLAPWHTLEQLCIGPVDLIPTLSPSFIDRILTSAAVAAGSLPRLSVMELWNEDEMDSCLLRYTYNLGEPVLTWRSTWQRTSNHDLEFSPSVNQAWTTAALKRTHRSLAIKIDPLPDRTNKSPTASFVHAHLLLKDLVVHPVTLRQLESPCSTIFFPL